MTTAFVFPGQGSQTVGMGKSLAETFTPARAVFEEVDAALGERLSDIIWNGPAETLTLTENAQPALMTVSLAAMRVLEIEAGVDLKRDAAFVAGHSLGEYSALAAARSLSVSDAARLCASAAAPCRRQFRLASAPWLRSSALSSTMSKRSRPT
jgi:[acyl-carrier-protein] S-malonyltransferase